MRRATLFKLLLSLAGALALAAALLAASGLDGRVFLAVNGAAARQLPRALPSCLTLLGNGLAAVALLSPWLRRAPGVLVAGLYAAPLAALFSRGGKWLLARPRPAAVIDPTLFDIQGPLLRGHNSFPSGHAITIFLVVAALLLGAGAPRARPLAVLGVLCLAGLVATSRIMVGAHWPSDALAGAALGLLAGCAGARAAELWPLGALTTWRWAHVLRALVVLVCALLLALEDTGYPLARPLQMALAALGAGCALLALTRPAAPAQGGKHP